MIHVRPSVNSNSRHVGVVANARMVRGAVRMTGEVAPRNGERWVRFPLSCKVANLK